jgi:uncharacterized protein (UPF0335 family)
MTALQVSAKKELKRLVDQIERLDEERKGIADDIRDKLTEAKGLGFDVKVLRKILALRKKSQADREEEEAILDVYLHALGMLDGTPLGNYAKAKEGELATV